MNKRTTRRHFMMQSALALGTASAAGRSYAANTRVNYAVVGCGGWGSVCTKQVSDLGNLVALCDVDADRATQTFALYPKVKRYTDFREVMSIADIDAVIVSTPDHSHAAIAVAAMQAGKDVLVAKPMSNNLLETRAMGEVAKKYDRITQMGIQGHFADDIQVFCELIWADTIGQVREVHAWTNRPIWPQGLTRPVTSSPVPPGLDWELWLGPVPSRPYVADVYHPYNWRGWWDFGAGALADMGIHTLDGPFMALKLSEAPRFSVECISQTGGTTESPPTQSVVRYDFPARGAMGPVAIYWYEGGAQPPWPAGVDRSEKLGDDDNGAYLVGERGVIALGAYSDHPAVYPKELGKKLRASKDNTGVGMDRLFAGFDASIKSRNPAGAGFAYSAPLTELVLAGTVSQRVAGKLTWDTAAGRFVSNGLANAIMDLGGTRGVFT